MNSVTREQYLQARQVWSAQQGFREIFSVADHWGKYAGGQNICRALYLYNRLCGEVDEADVEGDVCEFGTWQGGTLCFLAKVLQGRRQLHSFDHFLGFSDAVVARTGIRSNYQGSLQEIQELLALEDLTPYVTFHVGDICETVKVAKVDLVAYCLIDCDEYAPTKAALDWLHPRLARGGVIVFDEYGIPEWPGETQAADELLAAHKGEYEIIDQRKQIQPTLVVRRT